MKHEEIIKLINELGVGFFKEVEKKLPELDRESQRVLLLNLTSNILASTIKILEEPVIPTLMSIGNNVLQMFKDESNQKQLH